MKNKFCNWASYLFRNLKYKCLFILLFLVYVALLPKIANGDLSVCFKNWSIFIFENGLSNIYHFKSDTVVIPNYVPLYYYVLFLFGIFQGSVAAIEHSFYYLKLVPLIFDFVAGYYLIKYLNNKFNDINRCILLSLFFFLNFAYLYNTLVWGQVDSINACLIFIAFFFALKQRVLAALIFMLLAINFKLLSGIFLPLIGLMLLPSIMNKISFKNLFYWMLVLALIQLLIVSPFILTGNLDHVVNLTRKTAGSYPFASWGAANFWHWVAKGKSEPWGGILTLDNIRLWKSIRGITYNHIGLAIFFVLSIIALFPLMKSVLKNMFYKQNENISQEKLLIIAALIPLLFFFFNTEMMSRYSHTAFIFLAAFSLSTGKYFSYLLGSIAYFLNLVSDWQWLAYDKFIFDPRFIAFLYFICIIYLFFQLYDIKLLHTKPFLFNKTLFINNKNTYEK